MREFATGATRNDDTGKLDYDGFLSPLALEAFAKYMHQHRIQADGKLRDSDNWQKGMPIEQYRKSLWRHFFDVWRISRGYDADGVDLVEALCAVLFNAQGMLHETLKQVHTVDLRDHGIKPGKASMALNNLVADLPDNEPTSLSAAGTTLSELDSTKINKANPNKQKSIAKAKADMDAEAKQPVKKPRKSLLGAGEVLPVGPSYYDRVTGKA